jgi:hypothetical protein
MGANAVTTVPVYVSGEVLTAADLNITNSGVPVFAGTAERDAAFGGTGEKTLAEGQLCYLESTNVVQYYDGAAWATVGPSTSAVVQVKSTAKTDTFSTSSTTMTDVTGLSVAITPTSATNKVLVTFHIGQWNTGSDNDLIGFQIVRDSTAIGIGTSVGSRTATSVGGYVVGEFGGSGGTGGGSYSMTFLDSPATTSATTYKIQARVSASTGYVNRGANDTDSSAFQRAISTITVFEVTP